MGAGRGTGATKRSPAAALLVACALVGTGAHAEAPPAAIEPGVVGLARAAGETDSSQARALLDELGASLAARGFPIVPPGGSGDATHRAAVKIEQAYVRLRARHGRHEREGLLVASVAITRIGSDVALFTSRARSGRRETSKQTSDAELMSGLVEDVVAQWMSAFDGQNAGARIFTTTTTQNTKKGSP